MTFLIITVLLSNNIYGVYLGVNATRLFNALSKVVSGIVSYEPKYTEWSRNSATKFLSQLHQILADFQNAFSSVTLSNKFSTK